MTANVGKVYLVGAGPGDPGLITLRGCQCLARADVVLYDYLVNPLMLVHARQGSEQICLGRHGHGRIMSQDEVNATMIAQARAGRTVVRLKAGDPTVFARVAEELAALDEAHVPYEIVPGISAVMSVGSHAGIPLTRREEASAIALVTAQQGDGNAQAALDYTALATFPGTLVFYMGVTTAEHWTAALVLAGKSPKTPAAIVRRVSWPDQETIRCTLGTVASEIQTRRIRPPALVVIGPVAALAGERNWFVERPLFGLRVLATRPLHQTQPLVDSLTELGADVLVQPAIEILPPDDWRPVDDAIARLDQFDWVVFSSSNGVRALLDRLLVSRDLRALGRSKIAAIGPGTADELARYHLRPDLVPEEFRAESLAQALIGVAAGARCLLVRASRGRELLAEELRAAGANVEQVVAYISRDVAAADPEVLERLRAGQIHWVTVTSSAIARSLVKLFGESLRQSKLVSISPVTSATIRELGHDVAAEASTYTMDGLVEALAGAAGRRPVS